MGWMVALLAVGVERAWGDEVHGSE